MTKSIKKVLFIITAALLAVTLTACGTKSNENSSTSSNTQEKSLSTQEVIDKYTEAAKNIKNAKFTSDIAMKIVSGSQSQEMTMAMSGSIVSEPVKGLVDTTVKSGNTSQKVSIYFTESDIYAKLSDGGKWTKSQTDSSLKNQTEALKSIGGSNDTLDFYKNNANDFKVEDKGDTYEITYTGNADKFKDLMIQALKFQGQEAGSLDKVDLNSVNIKIVIKKSDFTPTSTDTTMVINEKGNTDNKLTVSVKYTFSDINSTTVNTPEGI